MLKLLKSITFMRLTDSMKTHRDLMRAPAFWWRPHPSLAARLLQAPAFVYAAIAGRRMRRAGTRAALPVVCVGNFTVGGSGKTPAALALAALLEEAGARPFFLTRGYGGRLAGPIRVDPAIHTPHEVGDEPLLLARAFPTIVARDRPAGAALCASCGAGGIVMDDGLQNSSLVKDLAIAVIDGAVGIGNGLCLPAGPLRAPLALQWPRVHAALVVGDGEPGDALAKAAEQRGKPVLTGRLEPDPAVAARLNGRRVLAFAGIGRPDKFFRTLGECGATLVRTRAFADHHPYRADEIRLIIGEADADGLELVTTEKDLVRIAGLAELGGAATRIQALPVRLAIDDMAASRTLLSRVAKGAHADASG
jgi:tetraacyldisaccharide 4'-kinase